MAHFLARPTAQPFNTDKRPARTRRSKCARLMRESSSSVWHKSLTHWHDCSAAAETGCTARKKHKERADPHMACSRGHYASCSSNSPRRFSDTRMKIRVDGSRKLDTRFAQNASGLDSSDQPRSTTKKASTRESQAVAFQRRQGTSQIFRAWC